MKSIGLIVTILLSGIGPFGRRMEMRIEPQPVIYFEFNSSQILGINEKILGTVRSFFDEKPQGVITIIGHSGSGEDTQISIDRAMEVRDWFMRHDINKEQLLVEDRQNSKPGYLLKRQIVNVMNDIGMEALKEYRIVEFRIASW